MDIYKEVKSLREALAREVKARARAEGWIESEQRSIRSLASVEAFMNRTKSKGARLREIRRQIDNYVDTHN
jgi:hypothetical protein